jgi:hypothetical protein
MRCGLWRQEERAGPGVPQPSAWHANPAMVGLSCLASIRVDYGTAEALSGTYPRDRRTVSHSSQTLETVKHHLKPIRERSVGARQEPGQPVPPGHTPGHTLFDSFKGMKVSDSAPPATKSAASRPTPPTPEAGEPVPEIKLDAVDAAEFAEMPAIPQPVAGPRPWPPGPSLAEFVGHPAYGISQLRNDLERCVFLLGGSDGEPLFVHPSAIDSARVLRPDLACCMAAVLLA